MLEYHTMYWLLLTHVKEIFKKTLECVVKQRFYHNFLLNILQARIIQIGKVNFKGNCSQLILLQAHNYKR